jgi:hypothetical protein
LEQGLLVIEEVKGLHGATKDAETTGMVMEYPDSRANTDFWNHWSLWTLPFFQNSK